MAYQKLQAGKAWSVNPSDNTDIPDVGLGVGTGTTTSGSATQLIDAGRTGTDTANQATLNFITAGVKPGMIAINTTDGTQSEITAVVNGTTLTVAQNIFAVTAKAYAIYGGQQNGAVLYIGTAGNLRVTTIAGDDVTFVGINTGAFFPVQVKKVWATGGTTVSNIIALW
ncbi:hypothetical protein OAC97_02165 [Flavobacteriaceae bacterium]|jgi:hypothetical protein|nr:hypothetical protein [Flavobacteriaceae bacterium]